MGSALSAPALAAVKKQQIISGSARILKPKVKVHTVKSC